MKYWHRAATAEQGMKKWVTEFWNTSKATRCVQTDHDSETIWTKVQSSGREQFETRSYVIILLGPTQPPSQQLLGTGRLQGEAHHSLQYVDLYLHIHQ